MTPTDAAAPVDVTPGRPLRRRDFLAALAAAGAGTAVLGAIGAPVAGAATGAPTPAGGSDDTAAVFPCGIASGDPRPDGAALWTKIARPAQGGAVDVLWEVSPDASFDTIAVGGVVSAVAATDYTVGVDVTSLLPDRWYRYRFSVGGVGSVVGRLRTAPAVGATADSLRLVFASCQQRNSSYYVAHTNIVAEQPDFLVHLGDYIYVSDDGTVTVDDYREVHRRFKSNPLLQDCHANVPLVAMWDDGEFSNDLWREWDLPRMANARQAWFEYMPVPRRTDDPDRLYRAFPWGDLADMHVIDLRTYSDNVNDPDEARYDPGRRMLGAEQLGWLQDSLAASTARWRLIGQGTMILPWRILDLDEPWLRALNPEWRKNYGVYAPTGAWDKYTADRRRLLEFLAANSIPDVAFLSGDLHLFFAGMLRPDIDDDASPYVGVDFSTGSLTADPDPRTLLDPLPPAIAEFLIHIAEDWTRIVNPDHRYVNLLDQGYTVVDADPEQLVVTMRRVDSFDPDAEASTLAKFRVRNGSPEIERLA